MSVQENKSIDIFENDIQMYLQLFCEEQGIEDLRTQSQSVWNACLMYIRKHVFFDKSMLKQKNNTVNSNAICNSNYNAYDYEIINNICDIYIYYCSMYDKEVSIIGFSNLTGISSECIEKWGYEERLSTTSFSINQKLTRFREESLSNKLVTGAKNPVGVIAVLNRQFGWASPYTSDSNKQKVAKQDSELPQLGANNCLELPNNSTQSD